MRLDLTEEYLADPKIFTEWLDSLGQEEAIDPRTDEKRFNSWVLEKKGSYAVYEYDNGLRRFVSIGYTGYTGPTGVNGVQELRGKTIIPITAD